MAATAQLALTVVMGVLLLAVASFLARFEDWRSYAPVGSSGGYGYAESNTQTHEKPAGIIRWITTVDHKDIGLLYGTFGLLSFAWGGISVLLMRIELFTPSGDFLSANMYNSLMTTHGITMLFLFGTPIIAAFANYFMPLLIGADDVAFPRLNAVAFWLLPPGAILIWIGFPLFMFGGIQPSQTSWTMYTPLASCGQSAVAAGATCQAQASPAVDMMLLGLHLSGIATTLGAINMIATIFTERGDDIGWPELDIFSWTILTQSGLILFAFPLLGSAIIMMLLDRNFGTTFFAADGGGAMLWQNLFWFFGHPEVYILILPPMGLISLILPKFSGRKLFGFKFVVYSTLAIGVLSFGVWAHHMFSTGMDPRLRASFMAVSMAIAIPSAVKTFNWITTMWNGRLRLTAPMLFCIGFVSNFIIGGVTGVFLAAIPVDLVLTDTYYVVGHFHYIVMGAIGTAVFAGIYYWFPVISGKMYNKTLAHWHFWLTMIGTNVTFFAMLFLGYGGMPRRYATYLPQFTTWHQITTIGAFILGIGQLLFVWNLAQSWLDGPVAPDDPWNLGEDGMLSKEWTWFAKKRETALTDGGEDEGTPAAEE
ncbi:MULTISPECIES: cbb3-type cytochrome c oxidase subunit I [unclassified Haladaptatus]|uniref:cbb3-type cytochrome c oxidase subunit I n=3 Tax=unclassified Haladaptatus TaxID=2622732 RepID=UPI00209BEA5F|nr:MULTISPECIES: cbb3-type cytochrome c oxidase subunit I [unclassified Haladaptatus]MCO8246156.1 cbb3-type cytochrome c oxidase subunit I [Haladaptatus sp. AB643]MCO8254224.1 cbb3-type cytochrome c oxidase subunit I [Haladaptatus sp. AB618]